MDFDPDTITQDQLHELRAAAEQAWSDSTRHPDYAGHAQPSAGQCYVTSRWLADKLGGHVGVKSGHYFWVSDDKKYAIDLTGDQFAYPPSDISKMGVKLDEEDSGWQPTEEQQAWRPGPILYKSTSHPLFKGFRIKQFKTENPRVKLFKKLADEALHNGEAS
jgi:hypothetical protein